MVFDGGGGFGGRWGRGGGAAEDGTDGETRAGGSPMRAQLAVEEVATLGEKGNEGVGADRDDVDRLQVQGSRRGDGPAHGHGRVGAAVRGGST
jgi:hypothetical protein